MSTSQELVTMTARYLIPVVVVGLIGCAPPEPVNLSALVIQGE